MKNNTKENQPFIYDRSTKTKIPVSKEIRDAYYGEVARILHEGTGPRALRLPPERCLDLRRRLPRL